LKSASVDAVKNGTDLDCGGTYGALRNVVGTNISIGIFYFFVI
jgi:hypothetical protein